MRRPLLLACLLAVSGCAVSPDYVRPAAPQGAGGAFATPLPGPATAAAAPGAQWWRIYDDPALDALVAQALAANTDLRAALADLKAADAVVSQARTARLPQTTIAAQADYGRTQPPLFLPGNRFSAVAGFQASYELDLFGRVKRSIEAAQADAEAAAFARAAVQVRVAAAVTDAYLSACTASEAIAAVRTSVRLTQDSARVVQLQEQAGSAAVLDVARAQAQVAEVRATLPPLENQRAEALDELAALLGTTPSQAPPSAARCTAAPEPRGPVPVGDIAGLLARRPDVAEAERRLAAATARIGVATADLYPTLSLAGDVAQTGGQGISLGRGFIFGVGPALTFTYPNAGVARARVRQSQARAEAALAGFDGAVLTAVKETEQALGAYDAALRRREQLQSAVQRTDQAFHLADLRYRAGSLAYVDVIVAQSDLVRTRLTLAEQDQAVASALVALFKSLGGGWTPEAGAPAPRTVAAG